jgi:YkoY family integral membrane protein
MMHSWVADVPVVGWYILVLVFLEGLLSADNALVLAVMVRHLSRRDGRRVLQWGIWGAIGFRVVAVFLSAILLKFWIFKVVGGLYLLYLAISHFWSHRRAARESDETSESGFRGRLRAMLRGFWGTVISVTFADIAFSIDSILAAVAMADGFPARFGDRGKLYIVLTGGVLGIITMRFVVRYFVLLLDRFPGLAEGAYYLVAWIGLKLTVSGISDAATHFLGEENVTPFHIPEVIFWSGMILIMILSFLISPKGAEQETREASEELDLLERGEQDDASTDQTGNSPAAQPGDDDAAEPRADQVQERTGDHASARGDHPPA